jgi:hypothetical protein
MHMSVLVLFPRGVTPRDGCIYGESQNSGTPGPRISPRYVFPRTKKEMSGLLLGNGGWAVILRNSCVILPDVYLKLLMKDCAA